MNGAKLAKLFRTMVFLCLVMMLASGNVMAQLPLSRKEQRRQERYEREQRRAYEQRREAALKHRYGIQTPEVKARMKETRRRSELFTRKKREPFYRRWWNKLRKKRKKHKRNKRKR